MPSGPSVSGCNITQVALTHVRWDIRCYRSACWYLKEPCLLQWDCTLPVSPSQVKLKPLTPQTEEEKIEHSIAAERRRMRLVHKDTLKDLLIRSPCETGTVSCSQGCQPQNSPDTHW